MQRFKDILFVVTPDTPPGAAFKRASALADNNQARLTVIKVIDEIPNNTKLPDSSLSPKDLQARLVADHQQGLEELAASCSKKIEIQIKVLIGIPFIEITREVLRGGHDLVIKIAKSDDKRLVKLFGSDDMHLLRKCPCPVLLIKSNSHEVYHRILAAVDADDNYAPKELNTRHLLNIKILEMASSLALSEAAELHVVHAWRAIAESMLQSGFIKRSAEEVVDYVEEVRQQHTQKLNMLMDEITSKLGQDAMEHLKPKTQLVKGLPRVEIPDFAEKIKTDLVVMGTVGRTGIPGLIMGNTAETILNQINCSVLAIKPSGFVSPVTLEN